MATPAPSWNTCRVYGTWHKLDGSRRTGTYKVTIPVRVTNATDDVIVPAGVAMQGTLEVDSGSPSLDILVPASNDPDNSPNGWQAIVEVTFSDAAGERYVIDTPVDGEVNLRTVVLAESIPVPKDVLIRGVPGGLAELDETGVLKAEQVPEGIGGGGLDEEALEGYLAANVLPTIVPTTRTIAGKPLTSNVTLAASDVGAVPTTRTVAGKALTSNVTLAASDVGAVPTSRTVNGKALSANVTLNAGDVSALPVAVSRPVIYATAANTWPSRSSVVPAGYAGPVEWDHSAYGEVTTLPGTLAANDFVVDLAP